jgi:hypothetical protein
VSQDDSFSSSSSDSSLVSQSSDSASFSNDPSSATPPPPSGSSSSWFTSYFATDYDWYASQNLPADELCGPRPPRVLLKSEALAAAAEHVARLAEQGKLDEAEAVRADYADPDNAGRGVWIRGEVEWRREMDVWERGCEEKKSLMRGKRVDEQKLDAADPASLSLPPRILRRSRPF